MSQLKKGGGRGLWWVVRKWEDDNFTKRLVFMINVCTARDILIFVVKNSGLLISIPLVRISNFCFLFNFENFGIKYSTRLNKF